MGPTHDNGRPVPPEGAEARARTGSGPTGGGLVPFGQAQALGDFEERSRQIRGTTMCVTGGLASVVTPVLSCLIISLGAGLLGREPHGTRGLVSALVESVFAAIAGAVLLGVPQALVQSLIACAVSCVAAYLAARRGLSASRVVLVSVVCAAVMIGADTIVAHMSGTTVGEVLSSTFDQEATQMLADADIETRMVIRQTRQIYATYWPTIYFGMAFVMLLLARMGARRGLGLADTGGGFSSFALPRWVAFALLVAVVANLAVTRLTLAVPSVVVDAMANVVTCARIVLAVQGVGVAWWYLERRGARQATKVASGVLAALLELSFAVMSVVGLFDVAVDFRGRAHGSASDVEGSERRD